MAVKLAGAALIVVATPLTAERKGVMVATGFPLASTETHGSRGDSETGCSQMIRMLFICFGEMKLTSSANCRSSKCCVTKK